MESQVCVHCLNKKAINSTSNRLVTESCGHVKCMDCLLHEKGGCVACLEDKRPKDPIDSPEASEGPLSDGDIVEPGPVLTDFPLKHFLLDGDTETQPQTENYFNKSDKKKKLETSHIRIETDGNRKYYFCTACKRKFQARSQVSYHAYCNGQQKPYQCPECNKSFASHSHFKYHMRVHRNERTYACELCGESFFQMSKLQRHKLKHTQEKKYPCPDCNKAFNNQTALRKHALVHTDVRPYSCDTCGRRFRDSSNHRKHVAKHAATGCARTCSCGACGRRRARAHACPRCSQTFSARRDMRRHAAVHTDWKPFRCRVCSRRFRRKDNLERHVRNTHPASPAATPPPERLKNPNPLPPPPVNLMLDKANRRLPASLPPIDESKFIQLAKLDLQTNRRLPASLPPIDESKFIQLAKLDLQEPKEEPLAKPQNGTDQQQLAQILAANTARRSVIFGPVARRQEPEYVHKIRKANRRLPALLPPIDESKFDQLDKLDLQNNLEIGAPPEKYRELYKKILYERPEKEAGLPAADEQHWKKKKLTSTDIRLLEG